MHGAGISVTVDLLVRTEILRCGEKREQKSNGTRDEPEGEIATGLNCHGLTSRQETAYEKWCPTMHGGRLRRGIMGFCSCTGAWLQDLASRALELPGDDWRRTCLSADGGGIDACRIARHCRMRTRPVKRFLCATVRRQHSRNRASDEIVRTMPAYGYFHNSLLKEFCSFCGWQNK